MRLLGRCGICPRQLLQAAQPREEQRHRHHLDDGFFVKFFDSHAEMCPARPPSFFVLHGHSGSMADLTDFTTITYGGASHLHRWAALLVPAGCSPHCVCACDRAPVANGVATVQLNRPHYRNAFGRITTYEVDRAFAAACEDDSVLLLIQPSWSHSL
jgi:hypothetical protein